MSQIDTEIDKKSQNFPIFIVKFYAFFVEVSQTSWIEMFSTMKKLVRPVVFNL